MLIHMEVYNKRTPGISSYKRMFIFFYVCKTTNLHVYQKYIDLMNKK